MDSPLSDVIVLDFTHLFPGELCSTILSDLGLKVIRIEPLKPGLGKKLPPIVNGESLYYWSVHRNKHTIKLDLKNAHGLRIAQDLAKASNLIIENFRPGVMSRLGLGYRQVKHLNEKIIYCSISGYGQNSSWNQRPGHDLNYIAESGILNLNRSSVDKTPVIPSVLVSDFLASLYAALACLSALYEQNHSGKGKHIDISMFECALSTMSILATAHLYTGVSPEAGKFTYPTDLPNYSVYECADARYLAVAAIEQPFWEKFCAVIERPDLVDKNTGQANPQLKTEIAKTILKHSQSDWLMRFANSNCCVSPVNTLSEALNFLPTQERQAITHLMHPVLGKVPQLFTPTATKREQTLNRTDDKLPDRLMMSNDSKSAGVFQTLQAIGYSDDTINNLVEQGIVSVG